MLALLKSRFPFINLNKDFSMIRTSIAFFILAIIAFAYGAFGIAGISIEIGKMFLYFFLIIAIISFVLSLVTGKKEI